MAGSACNPTCNVSVSTSGFKMTFYKQSQCPVAPLPPGLLQYCEMLIHEGRTTRELNDSIEQE